MTTVYGPVQTVVPDGYHGPTNTLWSGHLVTGQRIVTQWNGSALTPGAPTTGGAELNIYATTGGTSLLLQQPVTWGSGGGGTYTLLATWDVRIEVQNGGGISPNGHDTGLLFNCQIDIDPPAGGSYCAYGTEKQPGVQDGVIVTTALIDLMLAALPGGAFLAIGFDALVYYTLQPYRFCASPPADMPVFTQDDYVLGTSIPAPGSLPKWFAALEVVAWPYFCQCKAAPSCSPPPITPPLPGPVTPPPGVPQPPAPILCDGSDICATLNTILRQLGGIEHQLALTRSDVVLIQRQHVPFATVTGTMHAGLTGAGTFAVQGIIGLAVIVTAQPGYLTSDMETPPESFKFGDVTVGTADGYLRKVWIIKTPQLLFPIEGNITTVTYDLEDGVTVSIQELLREP